MTTLEAEPRIVGAPQGSILGWGKGIEWVAAIRDVYIERGTYRGPQRLSAKQRDILGVLQAAGAPLSCRDLWLIFDDVPRTWIDHGAQGLGIALNQMLAKNLVEKIKVERVKLRDPQFVWCLSDAARAAAVGASEFGQLKGVGKKTGRHHRARRRPEWKRAPQTCELCQAEFRAPERREFCSDACATAASSDELRDLVAKQKRDDGPCAVAVRWPEIYKRGHYIELDKEVRAPGGGWVRRGNLVADRNAPLPQDALEAQLLNEIVGQRSLEDIERMGDNDLGLLRARLRENGFGSGCVTDSERERLRDPEPHRGSAPSPTRERKSSRHRGRREQQTLMAGKRTSRKQAKRWSRELGQW